MTRAYITYHGSKIYVTVKDTFMGSRERCAHVEAVEGYPFLSADVQAEGDAFGAWNCNGYRLPLSHIRTGRQTSARRNGLTR